MRRLCTGQGDLIRADAFKEHRVVLDQQHGGLVLGQQPFQLHAGEHVDVIQRLVPDVDMGRDAQAAGQQQLFLLQLYELLRNAFLLLQKKSL